MGRGGGGRREADHSLASFLKCSDKGPLKHSPPKALSTCIRIFLKTSTRRVFESFSPVHMKTLKAKTMEIRRKYDSIPYSACVMLVIYDV